MNMLSINVYIFFAGFIVIYHIVRARKIPLCYLEIASQGLFSTLMLGNRILNGETNVVVQDLFNIELTRNHVQCLNDGKWLHDEVINMYVELLNQHINKTNAYGFNTFFIHNALKNNFKTYKYDNVSRWMSRAGIDIKQLDLILVPLHQDFHWSLIIADLREKKISWIDR